MILKQGFHLHPKTVMLRCKGGSAAVEALQQLWLFAENNRAWQFPNWTREFVAAVGSLYGKPDFADILLETGFLEAMPDGGFAIHDFAQHNAALIQRWENGRFGKLGSEFGRLGGRPRNPRETPGGGSEQPPVGGPKNPPTRPDQTRPVKTLSESNTLQAELNVDSFPRNGSPAKPVHPPAREDDEAWIRDLERDPTYTGVRVREEFGKMSRWCEVNHKKPTHRRFVNWLNRIERPMKASNGRPHEDLARLKEELGSINSSMREMSKPGASERVENLLIRIRELEGLAHE